jgi:polyhydroxyalkanoate synthase subunit PhaC
MTVGESESPSLTDAAAAVPRARVLSTVATAQTAAKEGAEIHQLRRSVAPSLAGPVAAASGAADRARAGRRRDLEEDAFAATAWSDVIDRSLHASLAYFTAGLSPAALGSAYLDWATHLAAGPGKQAQLAVKASRKAFRLAQWAGQCALEGGASEPCIEPLPQDHRFVGEAWRRWPYNLLYQGFLLQQQWWHNATTSVRGVTTQHENVVDFMSRQALDTVSPFNYLLTNPELMHQTMREGGWNLVRGAHNFVEDWTRAINGKQPVGAEAFEVGKNVAVTPGKVVFRNRLIEVIQYAPTTAKTRPEPVLIVPAWIMKYYILDLSPANSLVKYLVDQGFTVFMVSWRNPDSQDRDLGMADYRKLGVMAALDAVTAIVPDERVHTVGYCIGGTLLSIAAAAMARDGDERLKSVTLFAAQTDFNEAGELMLFINESQIAFLEDMMWEKGYLDAKQMSGAFQLLRSNDLIWSKLVREYLMGERQKMSDLMAWNADATRMPYRMHSEYLRRLFLNDELAEGHYLVDGKPVALTDIRVPIFVVGTTRDHVAPWRSVFKLHLLTEAELTFLLTSGGHNVGIVSPPTRDIASYQVATREFNGHYHDPDAWIALAPKKQGSWWPEWLNWLQARSGEASGPPPMGAPEKGYAPIADAPGLYVLQP